MSNTSDVVAQSEPDCPTADFHDKRIALGWWFEKLRDLEVRTPETQPLPLDKSGEGMPEWDSELAAEIVENLGGEAFVRTDFKSASHSLSAGSHIPATTPEAVDETIAELLAQQVMMGMPVTGRVYLREWLPLNWNVYARESMHPEVRAFVRDGEVVCHHPRLEWEGSEAAAVPYSEKARDLIDRDWNDEIRPMAERVAREFDGDGWFSVDFVLTTGYEWYCTDMALDALYNRENRGGDGWSNISAHPGDCENDLEAGT